MQKVLKGDRTKTKLAATLKELLNKKPLEKVRIHELTEQCDIHRQTFYYHFSDVYDLFTWCVRADTKKLSAFLEQFSTWQETMNGLLMYIGKKPRLFQGNSGACVSVRQTGVLRDSPNRCRGKAP